MIMEILNCIELCSKNSHVASLLKGEGQIIKNLAPILCRGRGVKNNFSFTVKFLIFIWFFYGGDAMKFQCSTRKINKKYSKIVWWWGWGQGYPAPLHLLRWYDTCLGKSSLCKDIGQWSTSKIYGIFYAMISKRYM